MRKGTVKNIKNGDGVPVPSKDGWTSGKCQPTPKRKRNGRSRQCTKRSGFENLKSARCSRSLTW